MDFEGVLLSILDLVAEGFLASGTLDLGFEAFLFTLLDGDRDSLVTFLEAATEFEFDFVFSISSAVASKSMSSLALFFFVRSRVMSSQSFAVLWFFS